MTLTHVLQPITLGGLEIRNRVVRSAHFTNLGSGIIGDDTIAYHLARAVGGVGLTIIEVLAVHETSPGGNNIWMPGNQDGYRKLVDTILPTGMRLFQQLWHAGNVLQPADGGPPWSASNVPNPLTNIVPVAMTKAMIDEIVEAYANAAAQCERWGIQGVELHASHSYLPAQFLSPAQNKRKDDYGGCFENRARFTIEVLEAIRAAVSSSMVVGIRVGADASGGGVSAADYLSLVQMLEKRNLLDFVDVSMGGYHNSSKMVGGMHEPTGYQLDTSGPITRSSGVPTILNGRYRTLEEADQVIRAGEAELVALTRAHIADPDIVRKTAAGQAERVRPCIGCNQGCLGGISSFPPRLGCAVNPAVGFERFKGDDKLPLARPVKNILVVGGGPAGLEAARVAALRGHKVVLAEAQSVLGGQINLAAKAPTRHGMRDITNWLEQEVYSAGVDVRLSSYIEVADILAERPDEVIIATGSMPRMDGVQTSNPGEPIDGFDDPRVISSHEVFEGRRNLGTSAVVIDDVGHYEGIAVSEYLAERGLSVTMVTRHPGIAPLMDATFMNEPALIRLSAYDFKVIPRSRVISVDDAGVVIGPTYLPRNLKNPTRVRADTIVFISHNASSRTLLGSLADKGIKCHVVGDVNSPRFLDGAIREGNMAGMTV